jgi:hypothetical protein
MIRYRVNITGFASPLPEGSRGGSFSTITRFPLRCKGKGVWRFYVGDVRGSKKRETGPPGDPPQTVHDLSSSVFS